MAAIRRQVDLIVAHMLELGAKSQQIGGILGIMSELSEQTNILAINASIEAAGAVRTGPAVRCRRRRNPEAGRSGRPVRPRRSR